MRRSPPKSLSDDALALAEAGRNRCGFALFPAQHGNFPSRSPATPALDLSRINHVCISHDAAAPLLDAGIHGVLIAKTPDEQAMFAIVNALAGLPELSAWARRKY